MLPPIAVNLGGALAKRLVADAPANSKLPPIAWFLFAGDLLLFLPVLLTIGYALNRLYPTLAAVEDPLPAYQALSMNDDDPAKDPADPLRVSQPGKPVTASLRATNRLLRSLGGWPSNFRGFGFALVVSIIALATTGLLCTLPFLPRPFAPLLTALAIAPLTTAWTHIVITPPSPESAFRRIPPARKTYAATWLPTTLVWAASYLSLRLPLQLALLIGLIPPQHGPPSSSSPQPPAAGRPPLPLLLPTAASGLPSVSDAAKLVCVAGVALALQAALVIPAHTALTRVRASLLGPDEDTVVPFDRSLGGRVEPALVVGSGGGSRSGFASLAAAAAAAAALRTVSWRSWARIYLLRVKVLAVTLLAYLALGALVAAQVLLVKKTCRHGGAAGDGEGAGAMSMSA